MPSVRLPVLTSRFVAVPVAALLCGLVSSCRQAASSDTTVVATAEGQVLTAETLSVPFGQSARTLSADEIRTAVDLWIDYQLLGQAVARNDTLGDPAIVDAALWGPSANLRAQKWYRAVSPRFPRDSMDPKALYESGRVLTVRQILFDIPKTGTREQGMRIRARIDSVRATLTPANFARVASQISADSLSRNDGGQIPAWPAERNIMLPTFEQGIRRTPFGSISGMILTEAGAHLVYRPTWREAQPLVVPAVRALMRFHAESLYLDGLMSARKVRMVSDVAPRTRAVTAAPERYADSATVLATITGGDFTAAMLVRWLRAYPRSEGLDRQLLNAPDTLVPQLLRRLITNELFLRQADSAGITLSAEERQVLGGQLRTALASTAGTLGVADGMLPDSVRRMPVARRQAAIAERVNAQFESIMRGTAVAAPVPPAVRTLLRQRYRTITVSEDGLARALALATRVRQTADSVRNNRRGDSARAAAGGAVRQKA